MDKKFKIRKALLSDRGRFDEYKYLDKNNIIYNNALCLLKHTASKITASTADTRVDYKEHLGKNIREDNFDRVLGLYFPLKTEPDLLKLVITSGWNICLPKVKNTEMYYVRYDPFGQLIKSDFGDLYEPASQEVMLPKVVLVPGLGFDIQGYRLGYGMGHFDRYFAQHIDTNIIKIGVCYDTMLFEKLPRCDHDIRMDYIITEYNIYKL